MFLWWNISLVKEKKKQLSHSALLIRENKVVLYQILIYCFKHLLKYMLKGHFFKVFAYCFKLAWVLFWFWRHKSFSLLWIWRKLFDTPIKSSLYFSFCKVIEPKTQCENKIKIHLLCTVSARHSEKPMGCFMNPSADFIRLLQNFGHFNQKLGQKWRLTLLVILYRL